MPPCGTLSCHHLQMPLLLLLMLSGHCQAVCPASCSCSEGHREVDCSWRGLRQLPDSLQHNIHFLNLSHNRLVDLDHRLSPYTHLRTLDISYNRLSRMPASLPRALWEIRASGNRLRLLEKNDTAYQWNLRTLDLSANKLERVVFINNTLPSLRALNLSHNRFWTVPTNMPQHLEEVDLSHNTLVQILPGSLDRLTRLERFYLHANRFASLSEGAFRHLARLRLITLGENPWACEDGPSISHLLDWVQHTTARVLGCPCHTWHVCGEAHQARTWGWHFATYTLSAWGPGSHEFGHPPTEAITTAYRSQTVFLETAHTTGSPEAPYSPEAKDPSNSSSNSTPQTLSTAENPFETDTLMTTDGYFTTTITTTTRRTTTLRTRSVKRANQGTSRNTSSGQGGVSPFLLVLGSSLLATVVKVL
ncbi:oligodendrocyte-myelin glycoprotein [Chanos chanos]|uniref:Oligodendrocyte-myelin glycoprotein n=1 Tax=Chanos chanos TaxID=29144 RepID=A0A6J2WWT5_CHACN|nr:oligodendrocyte-myelin glycoprotein [Chanos chanos]